jgi:hypothetical protein
MSVQKQQSMWERYRDRPAARPKINLGERVSSMTDYAAEQDRLMGDVMTMLADHANMIDYIKAELKETKHFMDWATATHEDIFKEYKSVYDIGTTHE